MTPNVTHHFVRFARNDVRLILRDKLLLMLLGMTIAMGIAGRFAVPLLDETLAARGLMPSDTSPLRFSDLYPVVVAFIALWQGALMPGTVFGFLLLDEKEDDTLTALRVTPVPLTRYLGYRLAVTSTLAFALAVVLMLLMGLVAIPVWAIPLFALAAAPVAPLTTLSLAAFARDKVHGLGLTKFLGVAGLTILLGWAAPLPWQWLLGLFPPFLVAKAYWMFVADQSFWWLPLLIASLAHGLALRWIVQRFRIVAFR